MKLTYQISIKALQLISDLSRGVSTNKGNLHSVTNDDVVIFNPLCYSN